MGRFTNWPPKADWGQPPTEPNPVKEEKTPKKKKSRKVSKSRVRGSRS